MEVSTKLQEMEEEIKVLKAEIRNVLLDIREVILDRTNPLGEVAETATIRMDLHTTASAMAAEAAAHEARSAMDAADNVHRVAAEPEAEPEPAHAPTHEPTHPRFETEPVGLTPAEEPIDEEPEEPPPPKVIRRDPRELKMLAEEKEKQPMTERVEIPPAYRVEFAPLSGNGNISDWLAEALEVVGPKGLSRIIAVHRHWGHLPPNLSRALAYIQEMLEETEDANPAWLRVMRRLDDLASL